MVRRSILLWIAALVITLASAVWQRTTGPTDPVRVGERLGEFAVTGKLLRTHSVNGNLPVTLDIVRDETGDPAGAPRGEVVWRRYPTADEWTRTPLVAADGVLSAELPAQAAAGKLEYRVELSAGSRTLTLPADHLAVARFKGDVPRPVLFVHIFCMFFGMLWSLRAGLEAVTGGGGLARLSLTTLLLLGLGGLMLGPVVQKYAFDAYWTGWPLGEDLTDNKLAVAVLIWALAVWRIRAGRTAGSAGRTTTPGRSGRNLAILAMLVTAVIFAIPHSMHGSTLDYDTMEHVQK